MSGVKGEVTPSIELSQQHERPEVMEKELQAEEMNSCRQNLWRSHHRALSSLKRDLLLRVSTHNYMYSSQTMPSLRHAGKASPMRNLQNEKFTGSMHALHCLCYNQSDKYKLYSISVKAHCHSI